MARQILFSFEVLPGMVLADDLYNPAGQLILPKGFILDAATIARLEYFSILEVPIEKGAPADPSSLATILTPEPEPIPVQSIADNNYSEKIRNSEDFKQFKKDYDLKLDQLNNVFAAAIKSGDAIDVEQIYNDTLSLIEEGQNPMRIFDILHNLRDYDDATSAHSQNVGLIAATIAKWLNFSEDDIKQVTIAGLLHDIGKLQIPKEILLKTDRLSPNEYAIMKDHVKLGYAILKDQPIDNRIKEACLLHHERCDGSGYPFNLANSKIPPFAKIVAIADVYDAMTASRSYRGALCPFDVIQMFDQDGLSKYDPHYIMTFLNHITDTYLHNNVRLNDGRIGEIIMINQMCLYRPVVRIGSEFVDLLTTPELKIEAIV